LLCCQYGPGRRGLWEAARADALPSGRKCRDMEGILVCAGAIAVLVGLGALVEAARPRRSGRRGPVDRAKLSVRLRLLAGYRGGLYDMGGLFLS
jgi:hypothetical protein